jgi:major membrane immunogen (membrane-anchored lipoprotein)
LKLLTALTRRYWEGGYLMKKRFIFLLLLVFLLLSACSNSDEFSGKTFDVSVMSISPDSTSLGSTSEDYQPLMILEFLNGNIVKNQLDEEEGTYKLKDDKLVVLFENENEYLEAEFTLKESDKEFSTYSAEISDIDFQMEDSEQVSKYKGFYQKLWDRQFEFIER